MSNITARELIESLAHDPVRQARVAKDLGLATPGPAVEVEPSDGYRSNLERRYAKELDRQKAAGNVVWWGYEPVRLRLADGAFYKPDFAVIPFTLAGQVGAVEFHETKGFWREAARVRIKVAAEVHPFVFVAVTLSAGTFNYERFAACFDRVIGVRGSA